MSCNKCNKIHSVNPAPALLCAGSTVKNLKNIISIIGCFYCLNTAFTNSKYFIFTYFAQPQYFDREVMLMAGKELRKLTQLNNEIFRRINDKVCYTVSEKSR